jgi:serine/threonine-protein kinase
MTPEGYERLMAVFDGACARPAEDRAAWLDEACAGSEALRRDVERLLAADRRPDGLLDSAAASLAFARGSEIGPYRLEAKLGEGGMGIVFRARDTRLNRPVAVKLLTGELPPAARRRFQREAQTASSLNHPHILRSTTRPSGETGNTW